MEIPHTSFFNETSVDQIKSHLENLNRIQNPEKIHLETLNKWIKEEEAKSFSSTFGLASNLVAIMGCVIVVVILVFLYLRYRKARAQPQAEAQVAK